MNMGGDGDSSDSKLDAGDVDGVAIIIRCSNGSKFTVRTSLESTVNDFKALLAQNCDIPAEHQRLIYKGRILKDDQTLQSFDLQGDHTVHMVRGFAPGSSAPHAATAVNDGNLNPAPSVTRGVGSAAAGGFGNSDLGASLFSGLGSGGASGLFGVGLPELEQIQQQMTQNPAMMRDIMNMPAIQNLMNSPELMRSFFMNNPQMRELIDRNPELGHVLNDPGILRQTLEAARNPELMREMMRNTDRAMSNIESSPEGFNMLRRMYENVHEPLLNATTMAGNATNDLAANPFAALLGNQVGTQPTGASNNPSPNISETATGNSVPNSNPLPNPWSSIGAVRSSPGNARIPGIGGLVGLGLQGSESPFGGVPDPAQLSQFLQNPAMSQMMQSVLSNPQYMSQMLNFNPQLRAMMDLNPQMGEMMRNPEFLRQLSSPETMQQMLTLQQSLMSQLNRQPSSQEPTQSAATTTGAPNDNGLELLMNMFGGLGAGGLTAQNQPNVPPEELYATQLSQLQEMGFFDTQENIRALRATSGNVHAAVERLLSNPGQ